jgi:hypothetical protein
MHRRAGLRPARGAAQAPVPPPPILPPIAPPAPPVIPQTGAGRRAQGRGRPQGRAVAVAAAVAAALLPAVIQQQVVVPPGPRPPNFPAIIPPLPGSPQGDFEHVLEYIIGLDTQAKRDCVMVTAGCVTVEDLLYVETKNLLACLEADTPIMAKTRLKTLKKWTEDMFDLSGDVDVANFTLDVCKENQWAIARTAKPAAGKTDKTIAEEKLRYFNGDRTLWLKSKRELTAYRNQILNEQGISVYYVIRDKDDEEQYRMHNGEIGKRIYDALFKGRVYENDAFQVLQILRQWTAGWKAETHVDRTIDVWRHGPISHGYMKVRMLVVPTFRRHDKILRRQNGCLTNTTERHSTIIVIPYRKQIMN